MATQIVKSFQSEGGFSVKEATIIDENRHVIDAASVKVQDGDNTRTFKKEYIVHTSLSDGTKSAEMTPTHTVGADRIVFVSGFMLGTWKGYPVGTYNVGANDSTVTVTLANHGLSQGDVISIEFQSPYLSSNGNFTVASVVDLNTFTFTTTNPLNVNNPIVGAFLEVTSYPLNWEQAIKIESAVLSDTLQQLTIAAQSKTVVKDSTPPGQTWNVDAIINNTTKVLTFTPSVTGNKLQLRGNGIRWSGKVEIVFTERNY